MAYGLSLHHSIADRMDLSMHICTNPHMQHYSLCRSFDTSVWKKKIHTLSNWKTGTICHYQQHIIWREWEESYTTTVTKNCMYGSEYTPTYMSLAGLEIPWIIDHMAQPVMMREMKGSCFILSILVTNKYKQALLSITMHMDTETTKNNLLFMVARTWLGHLSFPHWLLSFVYPHTSWMLIVDSFLVCTNEGGKNSTLLWEAAAWSRRTKSRIRGGPVSQYSGTALRGSHEVHIGYLPTKDDDDDDMCISTPLLWGFLCYPVMQLLPQLQHTRLPWI